MNAAQLFEIIRSFGYTTSGQSQELANAIAALATPRQTEDGKVWKSSGQPTNIDYSEVFSYTAKQVEASLRKPPLSAQTEDGGLSAALKAVYCHLRGANSSDGLDSCDDFKDWCAALASTLAPTETAAQGGVPEVVTWAVERWNAEVANRPLVNVHRRSLDDTWRQVIRFAGGDPDALVGPSHDDLLAAPTGDHP